MLSMRQKTCLLAVLLATVAAGLISLVQGDTATPASATSSEPVSKTVLQNTLVAISGANGEHNPTRMVLSAQTDHASALNVLSPGESVSGSETVYTMIARGHFTGYRAIVPRGASLPTGSCLWVIADAYSGMVLDWGISSIVSDLEALGPISNLGG